MSALIKAEEVRAGDTLRVTFEGVVQPNGYLFSCPGLGWTPETLAKATTIERLAAPLKVGDRVRRTCGIERPVVTIRAIVGECAVVGTADDSLALVKLADLRLAPAKVDGVFEAGDRVVCVDYEKVGAWGDVMKAGATFTVDRLGGQTDKGRLLILVGVGSDWFASRFKHVEPST